MTTDDPTSQRIETLPSSQKSPLTLEMIYRELMLFRKDMQESMEKLQVSIESLREEMTDRKRKETQTSDSPSKTPENKQPRTKKLDFNAVAYLQEHGEDALRLELENKANSEITQIGRSVGIKRGRDSKSIEREEMIQEVILNAKRRLSAGSVFLK
ncbi:MAG: hypothetical protein DSM106950_14450 [Stigonema ocellatum SAG 48.90 = DSM 106950]|nr:hypothetical protein [Stigonema ocellatum SAG 48.90 = DSM 106950]